MTYDQRHTTKNQQVAMRQEASELSLAMEQQTRSTAVADNQVDWNRDMHTGDGAQFGHLSTRDENILEENKQNNNHPLAASPSESEEDESEDSDAGPARWKEPSSLEMDCIFLEDENTKEENNLPQIFDTDSVHQLDSRFCMLCSETFGRIRMIFKHNCKRCGKAVCENCSKQQRKLSQIDSKKHRVCDECDALMANHLLEKMFEREAQSKKQNYEDMKAQLKDATVMREEAQDQLERAKLIWQDKTKETDKKIYFRERNLKNKMAQGDSLKEEIAKLQALLDEADGKLQTQKETHQNILTQMTDMEQQREVVGKKLESNEKIIAQKRKLLAGVKTSEFRESLIGNHVEEVEYVDRANWRQKGSDSDSCSDEETETEPGQSYEPTNILAQADAADKNKY